MSSFLILMSTLLSVLMFSFHIPFESAIGSCSIHHSTELLLWRTENAMHDFQSPSSVLQWHLTQMATGPSSNTCWGERPLLLVSSHLSSHSWVFLAVYSSGSQILNSGVSQHSVIENCSYWYLCMDDSKINLSPDWPIFSVLCAWQEKFFHNLASV